jgi:hypothetical protein
MITLCYADLPDEGYMLVFPSLACVCFGELNIKQLPQNIAQSG